MVVLARARREGLVLAMKVVSAENDGNVYGSGYHIEIEFCYICQRITRGYIYIAKVKTV